MVARTHGGDGWRRRTVSQNWDGDDEDQMVDDGVIEMTVRVFTDLVTRTLGGRLTDGDAVMSVRSDRLQKHLMR